MFNGAKIIIPKPMRQEMLMSIHTGHMGIQKSKERARDVLYWPGMTKEIENHVSRCSTCQEYQNLPQRKPLLPHCIPSRPWQMVGTVDLFWWNGANYLLLKNSLIIQEQNTKKNHKRVVVLYVIKNLVNLHKL